MVSETQSKRHLGQEMEDRACAYLEREGYSLVFRNFRSRYGEIDIVAWNGPVLVFVEVRYRRRGSLVTPLESITASKRRKLRLAVRDYLGQNPVSDSVPVRVDICSLEGSPSPLHSREFSVHITKGAIEFG